VSMLESLRQGFGGAGHRDQMHVIRHQAVTQQSKTVQLGVLPQQLEVGNAIAVAGQYYLPRVPTLRNMMGNINHDNAGEAGHGLKLSERIAFAAEPA